jgi:hypothetical protein
MTKIAYPLGEIQYSQKDLDPSPERRINLTPLAETIALFSKKLTPNVISRQYPLANIIYEGNSGDNGPNLDTVFQLKRRFEVPPRTKAEIEESIRNLEITKDKLSALRIQLYEEFDALYRNLRATNEKVI